jgi:hypothetical protein
MGQCLSMAANLGLRVRRLNSGSFGPAAAFFASPRDAEHGCPAGGGCTVPMGRLVGLMGLNGDERACLHQT